MSATTNRYQIEVVHSPADGGYYAEVWDRATGREVHATEVYQSVTAAETAARTWAKEQGDGR